MADHAQNAHEEGLSAASARKLFCGPCTFECAASEPAHFSVPQPALPEIAFIGRSNVGKSSMLNALTGRKSLARASNTPGRTQQILFFDLGGRLRLVDLPGYGFAKVPPALQGQWNGLMKCYLAKRSELRLVCILIDARRGVMDSDLDMMKRLDVAAVPYQLVMTKTDLVKDADIVQHKAEAEAIAQKRPAARPGVFLTSSAKSRGIDELRLLLLNNALID